MKTLLFLLGLLLTSTATFAQTSADEEAIKTVVEQESVAFHQRKAEKALSYWANVPYASIPNRKRNGLCPGLRDYQQSHEERAR